MKALRHTFQYAVYLGLLATVRVLPLRAAGPLGRAVGSGLFQIAGRGRRQTLWNLERSFPTWPAAARGRLARSCWRELGATVFDTLSASRLSPRDLVAGTEILGLDNLRQAEDAGRGILFVGAHLGAFEVAAWVLGQTAGPLHVVADPLSNPRFDDELQRRRQRFGLRNIQQQGAGRRMFAVLQEGGRVMVTVDQRTRYEDAIVATFFGQISLTSPMPAFLALQLGCPAVPTFAEGSAGRYRLAFGPPVWPSGQGRRAVADLTQAYLDLVEARIRETPELWMWHYRRWRPEWDDPTRVGSSLAIRPADDVDRAP